MKDRIIAVYILQRFVRMSRVLLPIYLDLKSKRTLSVAEKRRLIGIKEVYDNFSANPSASKLLINSDILRLIQEVYSWSSKNAGVTSKSLFEYDLFIAESDRLINAWDKQLMN
jgi:hypothetical protein